MLLQGVQMTFTEYYHKDVARKCGFRPFSELNEEQQISVFDYCHKYYNEFYAYRHHWFKESTVGDGNWISYDVAPHDRINAPHLKG
jgi:hypothetical protein